MPGFDGTGPRGMGPMTGGGRGFCNPRGVGTAFRSYGVSPRRGYGYQSYGAGPITPSAVPFAPQMTREQELGLLKDQADMVKQQLKDIESRIQELQAKK